jgi:hypothetical protein
MIRLLDAYKGVIVIFNAVIVVPFPVVSELYVVLVSDLTVTV